MVHYESLQSNSAEMERSDEIFLTSVPENRGPRGFYLEDRDSLPPPHIAHSHFIPPATVAHLMREKKGSAIGVKFRLAQQPPDRITNLEGALHTFVTPIVRVTMHGDYRWSSGHDVHDFGVQDGYQFGRKVLLSALVQQDFESGGVMARVAMLKPEKIMGSSDIPGPIDTKSKQDDRLRIQYDDGIRRYLIFHLTNAHQLPAVGPFREEAMTISQTLAFLANAIENDTGSELAQIFEHQYFHHNKYFLSLEVLVHTAYHQIRNEFLLLEQLCEAQGYVYTFQPPAIFASFFGVYGTELMSRIHVAALKCFTSTTKLEHCRVFAWADFSSRTILDLVRKALESQPHIKVMSLDELFFVDKRVKKPKVGTGLYKPTKTGEGAMLVIHNNSDAFGQNIETEPSGGSLDGVVGEYSSAAASLMRDRKDLCDHLVMTPNDASNEPAR